MHVQQEEQLQEGDATQTGQAEHITMQNAQYKTSRISAGQAKYPNPQCRKIRITQCTVDK